jgi:hypothetical protein
MNPRYLAYCRAHGRDVAAMLDFDRARAPGGFMGSFICWVQARWQEFRREYRWSANRKASELEHEHFTAWLDEQVDGRLGLVRVLAARHAHGQRLVDLLCDATDDLNPEQEAAFIAFCLAGDLDTPAPEPARAKARRPREVPGQGSLF